MLTLQFRKSITEVLEILKHMDKFYVDKIPIKFINFLNKNKLTTYNCQLNHTKKLNEMNLNADTINILGIIYFKYWCDKTERNEFMKKMGTN